MTPLLVGLALAVAAPGPKEAPKKDDPTLVGQWTVETVVKGGRPSDDKDKDGGLDFTADGKAVLKDHGKNVAGNYTSDAKKDPAELDITLEERGMRITLKGIFKIEKDTLTLCLTFEGDRPKGFESPDGAPTVLLTLKRAPKDTKKD
jgi:uncharacterized protein (TIGR03067 family)